MSIQVRKIFLLLLVVIPLIFGVVKFREFWLGIGQTVEKRPPDPLIAELSDLISRYENGKVSEIDLATITEFSWDRLYVFGPYTQPEEIKSIIGKSWYVNCFTQIDSLENSALLVFTSNAEVVYCLDYPMGENDFVYLYKYTSGFSIEEAHFVLNESRDLIWLGRE